ncbi:MAG: hypothetical protein FWJ90_06005 [Actinomadura sp.]
MDRVTRADLEGLVRRDRPGVHISLFTPTDRSGMEVQADRIAWKDLLTGAESLLAERGMRTPDVAELLAPAWELHDDELEWQYMGDGLAFFLRPGAHRSFRVPTRLPRIGTVGDRFVIDPLLKLVTPDRSFLVLALSRQRIRVLEASLQHAEEMRLRDVPSNLRDVIAPEEPPSDAVAAPVGPSPSGRGARAVFYGHGTVEKHHKKEDARQYLYRVAEGIHHHLAHRELPMVPVGLEDLVALYREVNTYPHLMEEAVLYNPDDLSAEDLHAAAWSVIERTLVKEEVDRDRERFRDLHGTGLASTNLEEIERSAAEGRVDTLFLGEPKRCWEELPSATPVVRLGEIGGPVARCEMFDRAAAGTLTHGGRIHVARPQSVDDAEIAAIFRYWRPALL